MAHVFNGLHNVLGQTDPQLVAQIFHTLKQFVTKQIATDKTAVSKLCPFGVVASQRIHEYKDRTGGDGRSRAETFRPEENRPWVRYPKVSGANATEDLKNSGQTCGCCPESSTGSDPG